LDELETQGFGNITFERGDEMGMIMIMKMITLIIIKLFV